MTENDIGAEGGESLSEMLNVNTTLKELNLKCEEGESERERKRKMNESMNE